jgi:hypothetical protein
MINKNKPFSVSFFGRSRLLGMVVVDGLKIFPKSMWYDYSAQMKAAIAGENDIANSGYMTPEGVRSTRIAVANQKMLRKTDVVLNFARVGEIEQVKITVGRKFGTFVFDERTSTLADHYNNASKQIVFTIGRMLDFVYQGRQ